MDSAYGTGWYFTDLDPEKCEAFIAYYCWRNGNLIDRVRYYLKFDVDNSLLKECREHVYMVGRWDNNLIKYIGAYSNSDCPKRPCSNCDKGSKYR